MNTPFTWMRILQDEQGAVTCNFPIKAANKFVFKANCFVCTEMHYEDYIEGDYIEPTRISTDYFVLDVDCCVTQDGNTVPQTSKASLESGQSTGTGSEAARLKELLASRDAYVVQEGPALVVLVIGSRLFSEA